jgi:hypothetical protein
MILMVIAFAAATLFWAIVEFGAIVCFYGFIAGERITRCPRCHHIGLTSEGSMHAHGCPIAAHHRMGVAGHLHLGHHS